MFLLSSEEREGSFLCRMGYGGLIVLIRSAEYVNDTITRL